MKIILIQKEIEEAIKAYAGQAINLENRKLEVDLTAGRGGNGFTAEIAVTTSGSEPVPVKAVEPQEESTPEPEKVDPSKPLFGKKAESA